MCEEGKMQQDIEGFGCEVDITLHYLIRKFVMWNSNSYRTNTNAYYPIIIMRKKFIKKIRDST